MDLNGISIDLKCLTLNMNEGAFWLKWEFDDGIQTSYIGMHVVGKGNWKDCEAGKLFPSSSFNMGDH